jgi:hypothetical protein
MVSNIDISTLDKYPASLIAPMIELGAIAPTTDWGTTKS